MRGTMHLIFSITFGGASNAVPNQKKNGRSGRSEKERKQKKTIEGPAFSTEV